jgi:hypothetical protein
MVYVDLVVEDVLQAASVQKVVALHATRVQLGYVYMKGGSGFIDKNIHRYAGAAAHKPFIVVRDLDRVECAPIMALALLPHGVPPGLLLCIPVREVEAWFLADLESLRAYLGLPSLRVGDPESIPHPKRFLVESARRSKKKSIRQGLVPVGVASVGQLYNSTMLEYVESHWRVDKASERSPSLQRFTQKIAAMA